MPINRRNYEGRPGPSSSKVCKNFHYIPSWSPFASGNILTLAGITFFNFAPKIFSPYRSHKSLFSASLHNFGSLCQSFDSELSARKSAFTKYYSIQIYYKKKPIFRNNFFCTKFSPNLVPLFRPLQYLRWERVQTQFMLIPHPPTEL